MCGIIGIFGMDDAIRKVLDASTMISARGKDGYGVSTGDITLTEGSIERFQKAATQLKSKNALFHNLHSMVGRVMQPFSVKNEIFAANCEIYNWQELQTAYDLKTRNDAECLFRLLSTEGTKALKELDGVYAFVHWKEDNIIFGRDIIGVKPLWYYSEGKTLIVSSEAKVIKSLGMAPKEVEPRTVFTFNLKDGSMTKEQRNFFSLECPVQQSKDKAIASINYLLEHAVKKRAVGKFGILFSGGIDSTMIAMMCKQNGYNVTLYSAAFQEGNVKEPEDIIWAKKVAEVLDLPLKTKILTLKETEMIIPDVIRLIEDPSPVKVGVALPFFVCAEMAKKDGMRMVMSGLGSEEIFAGYKRHEDSKDINEECITGLKEIHSRDMYRDDVIMMHHGLELRLPFLDTKLIAFALSIPPMYKIVGDVKKAILREAAMELGLDHDIAYRKKLAAQYGSNFDKALIKLAKKNGFDKKGEYLLSITDRLIL